MSDDTRRIRDEFDIEVECAEGRPLPPEWTEEDPALAQARSEIAQMGAWWSAHAPPLRAPARPAATRWWWAAVPLAIAAGILLVVRPGMRDEPGGLVARGDPEVVITALRQGAPLTAGEPLRGGDTLAVSFVPTGPAYVSVATLQEDGDVSSLVVSAPASATDAFHLPGTVLLDDYPGREWLVVLSQGKPARPGRFRDDVRSLLPDPVSAAERWDAVFVLEITRGRPLP